jgi:hypothetical protein
VLGVALGVLGSAYGVAVLGYDLLDGAGDWDGLGIVIGVAILLVTVPVTLLCLALVRALRRPAAGAIRRSAPRAWSSRGTDAPCRD